VRSHPFPREHLPLQSEEWDFWELAELMKGFLKLLHFPKELKQVTLCLV
jgi:hypothetical protein